MSPYYDQPALRQRGPEDVAGVLVLLACAVLAFAWYVAVSRLHLRNQQCLEIFLYVAILFFGGGLLFAQLVGRRRKREENWPHPAILIPASKDAATVRDINQGEASLLGYNMHKEPWLWPDIVRMKHGERTQVRENRCRPEEHSRVAPSTGIGEETRWPSMSPRPFRKFDRVFDPGYNHTTDEGGRTPCMPSSV